MRNRLQYFYSISVFLGVLATAYLMMDREGLKREPLRALQTPVYRNEAAVDPALNSLFEMENSFEKLPQAEIIELRRVPTEAQPFEIKPRLKKRKAPPTR